MAVKALLELELDESGAVRGIKRIEKEVDELQDKTSKIGKGKGGKGGGLEFLETISPRAAGAVKSLTGNISGLAGGFKTLRAAIISTGIGALVVVLGSLVAYFTQTKKGAELLERATAGLGAVIGVVTDAASTIGEMLVNAFNNPLDALEAFWEALKDNLWNRILAVQDQVLAFGEILAGVFTLDWDKVKSGVDKAATAFIQLNTGMDAEQQKEFAKAVRGVANEMSEAAKAAIKLTKAQQKLKDLTRELNVDQAKQRALIKKLNKDAEDTTKSYAEREAAAKKAGEIEADLMQRRVAAAEENLRIIKAQNALKKEEDKDKDAEAEAEIELYRIREESLELQTTLQNKYNSIRQQRSAEYTAFVKEQQDKRLKDAEEFNKQQEALDKQLAEEQKRIHEEVESVREFLDSKRVKTEQEQIEEKYARLREQANGERDLLIRLEMQKNSELRDLQLQRYDQERADAKANREKQLEEEEELRNQRLDNARTVFSGIKSISNLLANDSENSARKHFKVNKSLGIADAFVSTYTAIAGTLAQFSGPKAPPIPGYAIAQAIATGLFGLAQVKKIASQKFGGGGASSVSGGGRGGGGFTGNATQGTPQPTAAIDFGFQDNQQEPIRSYIIGSDVQDDMEARTRVADRTSL